MRYAGRKFAAELCNALGIEHCRKLTITADVNEAATITAEILVTQERAGEIVQILETHKYTLWEGVPVEAEHGNDSA